jgi:hypothetical protein
MLSSKMLATLSLEGIGLCAAACEEHQLIVSRRIICLESKRDYKLLVYEER